MIIIAREAFYLFGLLNEILTDNGNKRANAKEKAREK